MNFVYTIYLIICILAFGADIHAKKFTFCNKSSTVTLNHTNSKLKLGNVQKVSGWSEQSIIKNIGETHAGNWTEGYTSGIIIGQGSIEPATDLLISTSNALNRGLDGGLSPENAALLRTTSNSMHHYAPIIRNNSYLLKQNSNAIINLSFQTPEQLVTDLRNTSNALLYLTGKQSEHFTVTQLQQTYDNNRQILNGFTILDGNTLSLLTPHTISGTINLGLHGQGILQLNGDITFDHNAGIAQTGKIDGQGHALFLTNKLNLPHSSTPLHIVGNTTIDGNNNEIIFQQESQLLVDNNTSLTIKNAILNIKDAQNIVPSEHSSITFENITLCLEDDFEFSNGKLFIEKNVFLKGNYCFTYKSSKPATIAPFGQLYFETGCNFCYNPPIAHRDLWYMADTTARMFFNGCTLSSSSTGMRLTRGTLLFDHVNHIIGSGTTQSEAITFGNGNLSDNLNIFLFPGAHINVLSGGLDYQNAH